MLLAITYPLLLGLVDLVSLLGELPSQVIQFSVSHRSPFALQCEDGPSCLSFSSVVESLYLPSNLDGVVQRPSNVLRRIDEPLSCVLGEAEEVRQEAHSKPGTVSWPLLHPPTKGGSGVG